jgi:hypothetical protein
MGYPTFDEAQIYKSPTVHGEVRVAVELDYPVWSEAFSDDFAGAAVDEDKWFVTCPSWGTVTVAGGTVTLSSLGISPPWLQSRHGMAFPQDRSIGWQFDVRCRYPVVTGFGVFLRLCGTSFRDAESVWALRKDEIHDLGITCPDKSTTETLIWSTAGGADSWRRYRVVYNPTAQTYTTYVDEDDNGVYEIVRVTDVEGRYVDAIVIGNSVAIQGNIGNWSQLEVDSISVTSVPGAYEAVTDPDWARPFTYDGTRFTELPRVLSGRLSVDKNNLVDAASIELDNWGLDEDGEELPRLYTDMRFVNRRCVIWGRALDGGALATPWQVAFDGRCAEKQISFSEGHAVLTLPIRDRYRADADDAEVLACYSDAADAIDGVEMNLTGAEIIEHIYGTLCDLPATAYNVVATPHNTPRTYNVFRQSAQQAVNTLCQHAALACYQQPSANGQIQVAEWEWGTGTPGYHMSTAEEIRTVEWAEGALDCVSQKQLAFENSNLTNGGFSFYWPPHRQPWQGRIEHDDAVVCQSSADHEQRLITALSWWATNRNYGSITVEGVAQFWVDHDLELSVTDNHYLGIGHGTTYIVDGWEHSWGPDQGVVTRIRLIDRNFPTALRRALR